MGRSPAGSRRLRLACRRRERRGPRFQEGNEGNRGAGKWVVGVGGREWGVLEIGNLISSAACSNYTLLPTTLFPIPHPDAEASRRPKAGPRPVHATGRGREGRAAALRQRRQARHHPAPERNRVFLSRAGRQTGARRSHPRADPRPRDPPSVDRRVDRSRSRRTSPGHRT